MRTAEAAKEQLLQTLLTGEDYGFDASRDYTLAQAAIALQDAGRIAINQMGTYMFCTLLKPIRYDAQHGVERATVKPNVETRFVPYKPGEEPA